MQVCSTVHGCVCRKYIDADFLPTASGVYDFISVDGRARVHCLKRALPLLKPEGGILMLVGCYGRNAASMCTVCTALHYPAECTMMCCVVCRTTLSGNGMQMHLQRCPSIG